MGRITITVRSVRRKDRGFGDRTTPTNSALIGKHSNVRFKLRLNGRRRCMTDFESRLLAYARHRFDVQHALATLEYAYDAWVAIPEENDR